MLKVRRLARYRAAKYPRWNYAPWKPGPAADLLRRGGVSLTLLSLIEALGCDNGITTGTTGPPPVMPDLMTENEARQIITQVFTNNGITLGEDYRFVLQPYPPEIPDSVVLSVDGYNDSLRVGYEYVTGRDHDTFTAQVLDALSDSAETGVTHIKTVNQVSDLPSSRDHLEYIFESFMDSLRAQGVI